MSKAFTRESDDGGGDETPFIRPPLPPGATNYITKAGANLLRRRLDDLREARRGLANPGAEAGAAVTPDQKRLESTIRNLKATLGSVVVARIPADQGRVAFGALVTLRHESGEEDEYQIVGVDEADPAQSRISWMSPLARALMSKRAGEKVTFRSPAGLEELTVVQVRYEP